MNEMDVEQLVRDQVIKQRGRVDVPRDYPARVLRSIKSAPARRGGVGRRRDLLAATAILAMAAVLAGGIAWLRTHGSQAPGPVVTPAPTSAGLPGALSYAGAGPVRFVTAQVGWRVAGQHVYRTSDGGVSWPSVLTLPGDPFSVQWSAFDDRRAVVVSQNSSGSRIYGTIDAGGSWQEGGLPAAASLTRLSFSSPTDGWVVVSDGPEAFSISTVQLYRTADGGLHWSEIAHADKTSDASGMPLGAGAIDDLSFRDASSGWILARGSSGPVLYATTDGGGSWHTQKLPRTPGYDLASAYLTAPLFPAGGFDALLPVYVELPLPPGSPGRSRAFRVILYRSQDGGRTWSSPVALPATPPTTDGVGGGLVGSFWWLSAAREIWVSQDGGKSWAHRQPQLVEGGRFRAVAFADPRHAYAEVITGEPTAALERITYVESTDGGLTWHPVQLPS